MPILFDTLNEQRIAQLWIDLSDYFKDKTGKDLRDLIDAQVTGLTSERQSPALKLLKTFPLSSNAGLALMSLCECYPRITNTPLRQKLLKEALSKLPGLLATSSSVLNLSLGQKAESSLAQEVINVLSGSFVASQSLTQLDANSKIKDYGGLSIDCLGEAAQTPEEARAYIEKYKEAIKFCQDNSLNTGTFDSPLTVSIKLSALVTDFNAFNGTTSVKNALFDVLEGSSLRPVSIAIDAEEFHRSDMQREVVKWLAASPRFKHIKFSLAQQAYLANGLTKLAQLVDDASLPKQGVRVVKGAYYDQEVREAQRNRYTCPVMSSKELTDKSWALMSLLLGYSHHFAHFATHNPSSLAFLQIIAQEDRSNAQFKQHVKSLFIKHGLISPQSVLFTNQFLEAGCEIQYLYGMGGLRQQKAASNLSSITRNPIGYKAYAPVGGQKELLPYLVRRLLENGVNNSVWQAPNSSKQIAATTSDTPDKNFPASWLSKIIHAIFGQRHQPKAQGTYASKASHDLAASQGFLRVAGPQWWTPEFSKKWQSFLVKPNAPKPPKWSSVATIKDVIPSKNPVWTSIDSRIKSLQSISDALMLHEESLVAQLIHFAKKHPVDAYGEWQEALDFVNYYLSVLKSYAQSPNHSELEFVKELPYVYGEKNWSYKVGVGSLLCISPWNFPLAITMGQLAAGIAAGVSEIYLKPSPKLNDIYHWIAYLFKDAYTPVQLVEGSISEFQHKLSDFDVVLFTGSTNAFKSIKKATSDSFTKVIGETGGVNCLMADGSMEPGMVADTLARSSFSYSGQKCSCVRVAYIDSSIYDEVLTKLKAFDLKWGQGWESLGRDVIDADSQHIVDQYVYTLKSKGGTIHTNGQAFISEMAIDSIHWQECFGPVLQIVKVDLESYFSQACQSVRESNTALTFTLLSKDSSKIEAIFTAPLAGNQYVNRGSTGAVVQAQPFGGFHESGTGPKIGTSQLVEALCVDVSGCFDTSLIGGTVGLFEGNPEKLLIDPSKSLK